jgi:2-hydroxy-6-oxonona-2,4-dienedioate hydrolase
MGQHLTDQDTSRYAEGGTWKIHYNEAGEGHPVILLHGSGPGATGWSNFHLNIGPLSEHFRVLAIDAPGWGRSDSVAAAERDHARAVVELMDSLGIEKAALVGNSMGGATALDFATRYPERLSHLLTMGTGSFALPLMYGPGDGPSEGLKVLFQAYRTPTPELMKSLVEIMTFSSDYATDELAQLRSDAAFARPDHLENFVHGLDTGAMGRMGGSFTDIANITAPTLLIHGRDDRVVSYEHSLRLLPLIKNSRLVLLNQCGHWAQIEHADEFNRLVTDFITHA